MGFWDVPILLWLVPPVVPCFVETFIDEVFHDQGVTPRNRRPAHSCRKRIRSGQRTR
jgi:hypothetical protein